MSVRLAIVFLLFYETCGVDCAIIGTHTNLHGNNIINEVEQANDINLAKTAADNAKSRIHNPSEGQNTANDNKGEKYSTKIKTPMKIIPLPNLKRILHPPPRNMHLFILEKSTLPSFPADDDDLLKLPKPKKKLYHHFTMDDFIQRRKELKEKWQARHNKVLNRASYGLHNKKESHPKTIVELPEPPQVTEKQSARWNSPMQAVTKKKNMVNGNSQNLRKNIGVVYDQVTPRTRRILEHKEEGTQRLENTEYFRSSKIKNRFSEKLQPPSDLQILPTKIGDTKTKSEIRTEIVVLKSSPITEGIAKSEMNNNNNTTENNFNPANYVYEYPPIVDTFMMPEIYWRTGILPTSTKSTFSSLSFITTSPSTQAKRSSNKGNTADSRNANPNNPNIKPSSSKTLGGQVSDLDKEPDGAAMLRYVPERTTPEATSSIMDDVVSVKINAPFFAGNQTNHIRIPFESIDFLHGKSAEHVGDPIDTQRASETGNGMVKNEYQISTRKYQSKSAGEEVTQKSVENDAQVSIQNTVVPKLTSRPPESSAMKIAEDTQVNQDWRDHLRKAVKERLRKLRRDSID